MCLLLRGKCVVTLLLIWPRQTNKIAILSSFLFPDTVGGTDRSWSDLQVDSTISEKPHWFWDINQEATGTKPACLLLVYFTIYLNLYIKYFIYTCDYDLPIATGRQYNN